MVKLYVVRHGKTDWNNKNLAQGRVDIPLNDEGRKEAEKVLKNIDLDKIDICFCSPMKRTKETVEIIVGDKKEIIYDDLLVERSFGEFEGTVIDDETVFKQWDYKLNYKEKNVESLEECLERGKQFLEKIKKEYSDKTIDSFTWLFNKISSF